MNATTFTPTLRRLVRPGLAMGLAALLVSSCGRSAPTAPQLDGRARGVVGSSGGRVETLALSNVVAALAPGATAQQVCADHGMTLLGESWGVVRALPPAGETCESLCEELAFDGRVLASERDGRVEDAETRQESYASDDGNGNFQTYAEQPAAEALGLDRAHGVSGGGGIRVAVLDTGVDPSHSVLAGRLGPGADFVQGDTDPTDVRDFLDNDGDGRVDEAFGHGTHVAGIVALTAPDALILPVRVLDADGHGTVSSVAAGVRWAVANGARVINLSLGMLQRSDVLQNLLEDAENRGIVVLASAGNWGADQPEEFPASSSHAFAVAASDAYSHPASFTSFGSHVALSAPGVGVRSAFPGGGYRLWSGTSMSTPFVAGAAALLLSVHPGWGTEAVMTRLESTTRPLVGVSGAQANGLGQGMLDVGAALAPDAALTGTAEGPPPSEPTPVLRKP